MSKIKYTSKLIYNFGGGTYNIFSLEYVSPTTLAFSFSEATNNGARSVMAYLMSSGSVYYMATGTINSDYSTTAGVPGRSFAIYY